MRKIAPPKTVIALVLGLVIASVLVVAGWSALWALAAREAGGRTDAFIAAEAAQGRDWTCPGRRIGGYPFAVTVACTAPTYAAEAGGRHVRGTLGAAQARVGLADPRRIALTLTGPFTYRTSDGATDVEGRWRSLAVDLAPLPDIRGVAIRGRDVAVGGLFVGTRAGGQAASLDATATLADGADPVLRFAVALGGAAVPPLDELLGGTAPVEASLEGRLHKADMADIGDVETPEEAMERWRLAGGTLDVDRFAMSRAGARMTATGALRLDDRHRPRGKLDAEFFGLGPILKRYGINADLAAVGSLVGALFGGSQRKPPTPGALALPITLGDGRVAVGPVTTGIELTPLY